MKKILTLLFLLQTLFAFSQPGDFFYGDSGKDLIQQVVPAPDGNFFLLGSKQDSVNQIWLMKVTPEADVLWEKTYESPVNEYGHRLIVMADGSMMILGQQYFDGTTDIGVALAIKTDANGTQIWKYLYTNSALYDAIPSGDNFLLVGWKGNSGSAASRGLVISINSEGIMQWNQSFMISTNAIVKRIFPTADGNFLMVGRANATGAGYNGIFLRKIAPDGTQIWRVTHDTGFREEPMFSSNSNFHGLPMGAVQLPDGSVWLTNSYNDADLVMLHFSPEGALLEEKIYGNNIWREYPYDLQLLPDGGWLIAGTAKKTAPPNQLNGFVMRTDVGGQELWRKYYGGETATDRLFSGAPMPDGQLLFSGMSNAPSGGGSGHADGWLLKTEADGNVLPWVVNGKIVLDINSDCIANPGEPPAAGWFVLAENDSPRLLMTDAEGYFQLNTGNQSTHFTVQAPHPNDWIICNNGQTVASSSANPAASLIFVAQQFNSECPLTEVSITQPDLVRCDTSRFFVTVANNGLGSSENLLLHLDLDPALTLISASEPFSQNGTTLSIDLLPLEGLKSKIVEIRVALKCHVQLGATHPVVATISPLAFAPLFNTPRYTATGACDGNFARFELSNLGGSEGGTMPYFRVMADDLLAVDWTQVNLPEGAPPHILSFPADGRTWRVEMGPFPGYPREHFPAATVEGCGTGINGLHSVSYMNVWRPTDPAPEISVMLPTNTTGVPNKIAEAVHGLGTYNLHADLGRLEFTARMPNPLPHPAQTVKFSLSLSPTLDIRTFRVLSSNTPATVSITEDSTINILMENLQLDTGATIASSVMVRFVVSPFPNTPPDADAASHFLIQGKAYFDQTGPVIMVPGFLNYTQTFPVEVDEYNNYPPEIQRLGARNFTFATTMAQAADGSVFLVGETQSYSERTHRDGLIVKTNPDGEAYWLNAINLGGAQHTSIYGVAALPDGGCMVAGNSRPGGSDNYLPLFTPYFARVDSSGKLLWHKKIRPAGEQYGAWVNGLIETSDGHFVIFGYTENNQGSGNEQYYIKFNANGEVLWQRYEPLNNSAFLPTKAVQTADGNLVFVGPNDVDDFDTYVFLEKISLDGNLLWNSGYLIDEGTSSDYIIAPAPDGGFMFVGTIQWEIAPGDYGTTPIFIKFNADGVFEWEKKTPVGPYASARSYQIIPAPDGGYLIGGAIYIDNLDHLNDFMLLKIDENADTLWWRNYGTKNTEWVEDLLISTPDQIMLWGFNQSRPPLWDLRALLVRTDLEGNLIVDTKEQPLRNPFQTLVFPNPTNYQANIVLSPQPSRPVDWLLFDVSGRVMQRGSSATGLFAVEVEQFAAGMYFISFPGSGYPPQRVVVK